MSENIKKEKSALMIEFVEELLVYFDNMIEKTKSEGDKNRCHDWTIRKILAKDILKFLNIIENS